MVKNIDDNLGRLFARLDELKLADNTIVIFLTDNGPQQPRYVSGMRGRKGTVYDGGVRVPCYIRWPSTLMAGRIVDTMAAHFDLTPTLLDATGTAAPSTVKFDGKSLLPLLKGEPIDWPDRTIFLQWHRGDAPELYRAFAARKAEWKLVQAKGVPLGQFDARSQPLELFHIAEDPGEQKNVAAEHPEIVAKLRAEYEAWFRDVGSAGYAPPKIHLGSAKENPVVLTRQDWRGPKAAWTPEAVGHWEVDVVQPGTYRVSALFQNSAKGETTLEVAGKSVTAEVKDGSVEFPKLELPQGVTQLTVKNSAGGPRYVTVQRQ
jgi:arylsulfatase A-like enzyme